MKILYSILFFMIALWPSGLLAQEEGTLKIQDISLTLDGKEVTAPDLTLTFVWNKDSKEYLLFKNDELAIVAKYRISTHKSPRSSLKNSALNVIINYTCTHDEKDDKRRSEKIFYLDQDRKFAVSEMFTFKDGYNNNIVKLSYTGTLVQ